MSLVFPSGSTQDKGPELILFVKDIMSGNPSDQIYLKAKELERDLADDLVSVATIKPLCQEFCM